MAGVRAAQKAATRISILAAARAIFLAAGYEGASMRDIAAAAGRSTGAVFCAFEGKAELYTEAMGREPPSARAFLEQIARVHLLNTEESVAAFRLSASELLLDLYGEQP